MLITSNLISAQEFFKKLNQKYLTKKISIKEISDDKISIVLYYISSEKCMCESEESIIINKNPEGQFKYLLSDSESDFILINISNKIATSITVKNSSSYDCCSVSEGTYFTKPSSNLKKKNNSSK